MTEKDPLIDMTLFPKINDDENPSNTERLGIPLNAGPFLSSSSIDKGFCDRREDGSRRTQLRVLTFRPLQILVAKRSFFLPDQYRGETTGELCNRIQNALERSAKEATDSDKVNLVGPWSVRVINVETLLDKPSGGGAFFPFGGVSQSQYLRVWFELHCLHD